MECYICGDEYTKYCTGCCYKTCCITCENDIRESCICNTTFDKIIICKTNPNTRLKECRDSLAKAKTEWNNWLVKIKDSIWKLPIPLEEYISAFDKNVEIYEDKLSSVEDINSKGYYIQDLEKFEWNLPDHKLVKNKNKTFVITTRFKDFFENNLDKP